jgi:MOSC domain-containing protein YiiM
MDPFRKEREFAMAYLREIQIKGRVEQCLVGHDRSKGIVTSSVDRLSLGFDGIVGDVHSGPTMLSDARTLKQYPRGVTLKNRRQVSLVSSEELADIARGLNIPAVQPEWLGANLLVSAIPDFTLLPPATRLMFTSGATLIVDLENEPCRYPAAVIEEHHPGHGYAFKKVAEHKRGLVAWVEREGKIAAGDTIRLFLPAQRPWNHAGH